MKTCLFSLLFVALWCAAASSELHAAGGPGYALSFDGDDDRVQVGTGLFPTVTNSFTIELWANPTGLRTLTAEANTGVSVLAQRFAVFPEYFSAPLTDHAGAGLSIGSNGISVFEHGLDHLPSVLVYPNALSGWTHVALVYVNHTPRLYVNGTLVRTGLTSTIPFIHPSASLGTSAIGYGTYQGQLDEVRIWNAPLSQAQIQANMNRSLAGDEPNLVVYYRCDEGTGLALIDHAPAAPSVNGTLTVSGGITGPTWVLSGIQPFSPIAETLPATATGDFTNRLNGLFNPVGADTRVWFEWGTNMNYGNRTPTRAIGSGTGNTNWSEVLGGLEHDVTYHFRAVASNAFGIVFGGGQSFTTPPLFTDIDAGLPGLPNSWAEWGDYDNDGRLDIAISGGNSSRSNFQLWRNIGPGFTSSLTNGFSADPNFPRPSRVSLGDYNNDERLDILLPPVLWRNTGEGFDGLGLPTGLITGFGAWVDYDNDGRLDPAVQILSNTDIFGKIQLFRNIGSGFLRDFVYHGPVDGLAWGDYDDDGRVDLGVAALFDGGGIRIGPSGFITEPQWSLPTSIEAALAWGDYDNDGRSDIVLAGRTNNFPTSATSWVWRNTGSGFTNANAGLPGVFRSSVAWGDYDNDGRLDILLAGTTDGTAAGAICQVWRNTGNGFANANAGLPGVYAGRVVWGDYDNDGRLDILLTGTNTANQPFAQVWRNHTPLANSPPNPPTGLRATTVGTNVTLS